MLHELPGDPVSSEAYVGISDDSTTYLVPKHAYEYTGVAPESRDPSLPNVWPDLVAMYEEDRTMTPERQAEIAAVAEGFNAQIAETVAAQKVAEQASLPKSAFRHFLGAIGVTIQK